MDYWVAVTHRDWFESLRDLRKRRGTDEVNFWQPGTRLPFRPEAGRPFLFKLRYPENCIVGGGIFVDFTVRSCADAWNIFGEANGAPTSDEFLNRFDSDPAQLIGCNLLVNPFFFPRRQWIEVGDRMSRYVQQGKTLNTDTSPGKALWREVEERLPKRLRPRPGTKPTPQNFLRQARTGQQGFRFRVLEYYDRRCAITDESVASVLDAAHIRAHEADGPYDIRNGMLLRADLHRLFDAGYITVDTRMRVVASPRLREDFPDSDYAALDGKKLANVPTEVTGRPAPKFLNWHRKERLLK